MYRIEVINRNTNIFKIDIAPETFLKPQHYF